MDRMNKEELLELINGLKIDKEEFVILSTGALTLRGIYDSAKDLDIAVTQKGLNQLMESYNLVPKLGDDNWYVVTEKVECILDDMVGKKEKVGEYYLQDIYDYLNFIVNSGREKDAAKISLVNEYISSRKK